MESVLVKITPNNPINIKGDVISISITNVPEFNMIFNGINIPIYSVNGVLKMSEVCFYMKQLGFSGCFDDVKGCVCMTNSRIQIVFMQEVSKPVNMEYTRFVFDGERVPNEVRIPVCPSQDQCCFIGMNNDDVITKENSVCKYRHPQETLYQYFNRVGLDEINVC